MRVSADGPLHGNRQTGSRDRPGRLKVEVHSYRAMIVGEIPAFDRSLQGRGEALTIKALRDGLPRGEVDQAVILKRPLYGGAMAFVGDVDRCLPGSIVDMKLEFVPDIKVFVVTQTDLRRGMYFRDPLYCASSRKAGRLWTAYRTSEQY